MGREEPASGAWGVQGEPSKRQPNRSKSDGAGSKQRAGREEGGRRGGAGLEEGQGGRQRGQRWREAAGRGRRASRAWGRGCPDRKARREKPCLRGERP